MMLVKAPTVGVKAASPRRQGAAVPARGSRLVTRFREGQENVEQVAENLRGTSTSADKPKKDISQMSLPDISQVSDVKAGGYEAAGSWLLPAYTRRREVFAGRLAMVGLTAAIAWEVLNPAHPGPISAASLLLGWNKFAVEAALLGVIFHGVAGYAWQGAATWNKENQQDIARRPKGPPGVAPAMNPVNPLTHPATFLGISRKWGFSKKNELFNGRMAMLGFMALVLGELKSGYGFVGQVTTWMGSLPTEATFSTAGRLFTAWSLFNIGLAWLQGNMGEVEGDDDIY